MIIANKQAEIIAANSSDLAAIRDIATRIWNEYYPGIISQAQIDYMLLNDYSALKLQKDLDEGVSIDKLLLDGVLTGFAAYGPANFPDEPGDTLKLHKIYVDPAVHGKGLGSLLLQHVEAFARQRHYRQLILQVNKGNQRAIKAYTRNGYRKERAVVVDIGSGFVMDDYLMVKQVNSTDA